ncbi:hypothetical protein ACEQ8H_005986 [Pleosporales sp. CAS-2024a]
MSKQDPRSRKRGPNVSEESESSRSSSLMEKMMEAIQLEEKLNPKLTLRRFLSIRSVISTVSSFAERQQGAVGTRALFRSLGAGTCGRVYEVPGTTDIFKVANYPGQDTDQLWNDYCMHTSIADVLERWGRDKLEVRVPRLKYFVSMNDNMWWTENLDRFPLQFLKEPSNLVCAERILPLAKPIRESLIDLFAPKAADHLALKTDASNKDCLVRLYLGKRRERINNKFFQLRNFTMHLDQMEELELNIYQLAFAMGEAMAIMHWACHLDGNDVEFVLGSSPEMVAQPNMITTKPLDRRALSKLTPNSSTWNAHLNDFRKRTTHLWMLDFNRCKELSTNKEVMMEQMLHSFFRNDPYFPRPVPPTSKDAKLWQVFRNAYEDSAAECMKKNLSPLGCIEWPRHFMDEVVAEQQKKVAKFGGASDGPLSVQIS